jgi:hypothetical protein
MSGDRNDPLKLHRRTAVLDRRAATVLTLRPSAECRFATNYFHETWHVLSDVVGAQLLAKLSWALAYQRQMGTIAVIDSRFLVPNPFDADKSSPIVLMNSDIAHLTSRAVSDLKVFLGRMGASEGTVKLSTMGLNEILEAGGSEALLDEQRGSGQFWSGHERHVRIERVNGVVVLAAPPPSLKWWAIWLDQLGSHWYRGSDSTILDYKRSWERRDGEVQVFPNFDRMVQRAIETRAKLFPCAEHRELSVDEREVVWASLPPM